MLEVRPYTGGTIGYTYDGNGNVGSTASSGTQSGYAAKYTSIGYTSFNLPDSSAGLSGANGATYQWYYDERHARIKESRGSPGTLDRVTWMLHPDKANGLGFEQEIGGTISNRHYLSAGGQVVGVLTSVGEHTSGTATTITATEYWIKDHLGSSGAITNAAGAVTQRFGYDPWGQRRFADGRADPTGMLVYGYPSATDRGFTGHEHLDDVGIIHMNGRLYDGRIGRFLQADPVIQELARYQGFNRYSYVLNNPLNATDPTGEFIPWPVALAWTAMLAAAAHNNPQLRPVASILIGVILAAPSGGGSLVWYEAGAQAAFAGFASGATASGNLRGGFQGAGMALAFFGAGQIASSIGGAYAEAGFAAASAGDAAEATANFERASAFTSSGGLGRAALHAAAGCASAAIAGADCGRGALTAGLNKALAGNLPGNEMPFGLMKYSVIGGTIASIGGGKFANGAMMGAFQYLFNELQHSVGRTTAERLRLAGYKETKYADGIYCNVQGASIGACLLPGGTGDQLEGGIQASATVGATAMMGAFGASMEGGRGIDSAGQACWINSTCVLFGLGIGATIDLNASASSGGVASGWQFSVFGKASYPFLGGELSAGYGSDGLVGQYQRSFGPFIGVGAKLCVQEASACK